MDRNWCTRIRSLIYKSFIHQKLVAHTHKKHSSSTFLISCAQVPRMTIVWGSNHRGLATVCSMFLYCILYFHSRQRQSLDRRLDLTERSQSRHCSRRHVDERTERVDGLNKRLQYVHGRSLLIPHSAVECFAITHIQIQFPNPTYMERDKPETTL